MATLAEMLKELPFPVHDEVRRLVMALDPRATAQEMEAAVGYLSPQARKAPLAFLIAHAREALTQEQIPPDRQADPQVPEAGPADARAGTSGRDAPIPPVARHCFALPSSV